MRPNVGHSKPFRYRSKADIKSGSCGLMGKVAGGRRSAILFHVRLLTSASESPEAVAVDRVEAWIAQAPIDIALRLLCGAGIGALQD